MILKKKVRALVLNGVAVIYYKKANKTKDELVNDMLDKKRKYGIQYTDYIKNKLYIKDEKEFLKEYKNKIKKDRNVQLVAEIKNLSYNDAKKEMDKVNNSYDVSYKDYVENKLYIYKTRKGLKKKIDKMKQADEKFLNEVCRDTGWDFDKAKQEAEKVRKRWGLSYKRYSRYRFYAMTEKEQEELITKWDKNFYKFVKTVMKESGWSKEKVLKHMKRYGTLYDIYQAYYVLYRAWELDDEQMDSYARQKISKVLSYRYNDREAVKVLAEKDMFIELYKNYTQRKYWINKNTNFTEFKKFVKGLDYVFCKPIESGGGLGTEKHKVTENKKALYNLLMEKDTLLVEECIKQHKVIDEFMPGTVSTIRVICIIDKKNKCHVICTGIRLGNAGSIVDNLSKGGMCADINVKTGKIQTDAIDENGNIFEYHPVSGKKIKDTQIPNWDLVIKTAKKAMRVQEGINYVGWDIAVCEDKAVIIEGNSEPDLILVQAPYANIKKGMKYLFDPYLEESKKK